MRKETRVHEKGMYRRKKNILAQRCTVQQKGNAVRICSMNSKPCSSDFPHFFLFPTHRLLIQDHSVNRQCHYKKKYFELQLNCHVQPIDTEIGIVKKTVDVCTCKFRKKYDLRSSCRIQYSIFPQTANVQVHDMYSFVSVQVVLNFQNPVRVISLAFSPLLSFNISPSCENLLKLQPHGAAGKNNGFDRFDPSTNRNHCIQHSQEYLKEKNQIFLKRKKFKK